MGKPKSRFDMSSQGLDCSHSKLRFNVFLLRCHLKYDSIIVVANSMFGVLGIQARVKDQPALCRSTLFLNKKFWDLPKCLST